MLWISIYSENRHIIDFSKLGLMDLTMATKKSVARKREVESFYQGDLLTQVTWIYFNNILCD